MHQKNERRSKMPATGKFDSGPQQDSSWCAIYTRRRHEKKAAAMLPGKGFEVFLPLHESMRRWKDRNKLFPLPLFPAYQFAQGWVNSLLAREPDGGATLREASLSLWTAGNQSPEVAVRLG
jgi:hypothetical protein